MRLRAKPAFLNSSADRVNLWPVRLLFGLEAAAFALFLPRMPDVQIALGLNAAELGMALLGIPSGTLVGLFAAPVTVRKAGIRMASWLSVAVLAWLFVLPGLAFSPFSLFLAFFACGIGVSHTEIALNSFAGHLEASTGRRIMSQCHGFWSVGSVGGALAGGALAQIGVPVLQQSILAGILLTAGARALARGLPVAGSTGMSAGRRPPRLSRALLPLCLLPVGIMIIEGVLMDWSAIYLRSVVDAAPFAASLGFAAFAVAMAVVRLQGDALVARFGEWSVVLLSNLAAGCGTLLFALAPTLDIAIAGAALCGAGVAVVYPVALSAAARAPGQPEHNIAAVSFTSFVVLLGSPALFGLMAESFGFRTAIALCALLILPTPLLTSDLKRRKG